MTEKDPLWNSLQPTTKEFLSPLQSGANIGGSSEKLYSSDFEEFDDEEEDEVTAVQKLHTADDSHDDDDDDGGGNSGTHDSSTSTVANQSTESNSSIKSLSSAQTSQHNRSRVKLQDIHPVSRPKKGELSSVTPTQQLLKISLYKARKLYQQREAEACVKEFIRSWALARIVHGDSHWRYGRAQVFLAQAYLDLKSYYPQAEEHAGKALACVNSLLHTEKHLQWKPQVLYTLFLGNLVSGEACLNMGNLPDAEKCLLEAEKHLKIYRKALQHKLARSRHTAECETQEEQEEQEDCGLQKVANHTIRVHVSLANLWQKKKRIDLMKQHFEMAVEEGKKVQDIAHKLVPLYYVYGNALLETAGQGEEETTILHCFQEALTVTRERYDKDSLEVAQAFHELLSARQRLSGPDYSSILNSLEDICHIYTQELGSDDPQTLLLEDEIIEVLLILEDHESALEHLTSVLKRKVQVFGEYSGEVAATYRTMANVHVKEDDLSKAAKLLKKSLAVETLLYGPHHRKTKSTERCLALILRNSIGGIWCTRPQTTNTSVSRGRKASI